MSESLRLARLEVQQAELAEKFEQLNQVLNNFLNDPTVMASITETSVNATLQHLTEIGLDNLMPSIGVQLHTEPQDNLSVKLVFHKDNCTDAGAFSVYSPLEENPAEYQLITQIKRQQYDVLMSALVNYKRKKFAGVTLYANFFVLNPNVSLAGSPQAEEAEAKEA